MDGERVAKALDHDDPGAVIEAAQRDGWELVTILAIPSRKSLSNWVREYYFRRTA